jgi:ribonuclease P protein component
MLPAPYRLRRAQDFTRTTRSGVKAVRPNVLVFGHPGSGEGPARLGLAVGKPVGNAVVRHRVSRQIRGAVAYLMPALPGGSTWVIRALPGAASAEDLAQQCAEGIEKVLDKWSRAQSDSQ